MLKLVYPAIFTDNNDGTGYTVSFPDLLGCITFGEDAADAILMAQDAACGWILGELESGNQIPRPSIIKNLKLKENEAITLMVLDIDKYSEMYGSKVVKKNTTIPAWLNTFGERKKVNYSQILTDALTQMYMAELG